MIKMKYFLTILLFFASSSLLFSQSPNNISVVIKSHTKSKINFSLQNISNDTIIIENFNCSFKKGKFIVTNYTLSSDTLHLDWIENSNKIMSSEPINYYIDGKKQQVIFKLSPKEKLPISILLFKNDLKRVNFICVKLNQTDSILVCTKFK